MKSLLASLLLLSSAHAADLVFTDYDQDKLANFLLKLPTTVVSKEQDSMTNGKRVKIVFPRKSDIFKIECISEFYGSSSIPSDSICIGTLDENHPSVEKNYDEIRFPETNDQIASALHAVMPHGKETRTFRAGEFEQGTDFSGRRTLIFDFLFECSVKDCRFRFAERILK